MPPIPVPSDRDRDHLYEKLAQALGVDNADTLMAYLPARRADLTNVDLTNIAKKADLDGLESRLRNELTSCTGSVTTGAERLNASTERLKQHVDLRCNTLEARITLLEEAIRNSVEDIITKLAIVLTIYGLFLVTIVMAAVLHRGR